MDTLDISALKLRVLCFEELQWAAFSGICGARLFAISMSLRQFLQGEVQVNEGICGGWLDGRETRAALHLCSWATVARILYVRLFASLPVCKFAFVGNIDAHLTHLPKPKPS